MKKQIAKITLKTDKVVSLSKNQASNVIGAQRPDSKNFACDHNSDNCTGGHLTCKCW